MKSTFFLSLMATLLIAALLSACASPAATLDGTDWQLTLLNGEKLPIGIIITLNFNDGQAGGNASCNSYGAGYRQDGNKLTFEEAFSSMMYCDGVMDYESDYLFALGAVRSFLLEADNLSLLDASGQAILVFSKPQPYSNLTNTFWKAVMVGEISFPADIEITMNFADGQVNGKAACNNYFASYTQVEDLLSFSGAGATKMACSETGVMELETAFLASLEKVNNFRFEMGSLVLMDGSGAILAYLEPSS